MKSDKLDIIQEITKCTSNLGYCPIFTLKNNLMQSNDLLLMLFKDNICLVADINKIRTILKKNISEDLEVRWDIDENGLLQLIISIL